MQLKPGLGDEKSDSEKAAPLCPVFGMCGGCAYQNIPYEEELELKEKYLRGLFREKLGVHENIFSPIVRSPEEYHYRSRLDLTLRRRKGDCFVGFQPPDSHRIVPVDFCPIARPEISDFIPELKAQAVAKLPADYGTANLVVRTGDCGKVRWGGIGRRSLELKEEDYFWTEIRGKKFFYSLDHFFQANLFILPDVMDQIGRLADLGPEATFFDLYAGAGLFGIYFADQVGRVVMIEENQPSLKLMDFNLRRHGLKNVRPIAGKVEKEFPAMIESAGGGKRVAMIDPPRKGLSEEAIQTLVRAKNMDSLFYLSCHPESLVRDLNRFVREGWRIEGVSPFDFFPKTRHLETLVFLRP